MSRALLAGGCFWGVQALIRRLPGVTDTRVGYTGGSSKNPTYYDMKDGKSGHAEAIEIHFNPAIVSYREILEYFFQIHDPTTPNRQGNDRGSQYRSVIWYLDGEQEETARQLIAEMDASGIWPGKIVTEVVPALPFYDAEEFHQDFLEKNPGGYTCHFPRPDWRLPAKAAAE